MHRTLAFPVALLLFALMLAGCAGSEPATDGDDGSASTSTPGSGDGAGGVGDDLPTPPQENGAYVIRLTSGSEFAPADARIPRGATVVWVVDGGLHDVTEGHAGESYAWSSDDDLGRKMKAGDRYERTFNETGEVRYRCVLHESAGMLGTLRVE